MLVPTFAYATVKPPSISRVNLALRDEDGQPMSRRPYVLRVAGAAEISGVTTAQGIIDQAVAGTAAEAELILQATADFPFEATLQVRLEPLPPASDVRGAQARLNALGYAAGLSGTLDEATGAALRDFQLSAGLEDTGALDAATAKALDARWQAL